MNTGKYGPKKYVVFHHFSHNVKIILLFSWMKLSCYFFRIRNSQDKKPWDKLHGTFTADYPSSFNNSKVEFGHSSKETFDFLLVFGNGISSNFDSYLKILFKKAKEKKKSGENLKLFPYYISPFYNSFVSSWYSDFVYTLKLSIYWCLETDVS